MRRAVSLSIIVTGFTAMAAQIIYLRELLVVFYGNELSIAYVLACWLAAGGAGAWIFGKFSDRIKHKTAVFASSLAIAATILPVGVYAIRSIRPVLGINAGEIFPVFTMILSSAVILAPLCALLGFLFTLACRISEDIGKPYVLESAGSIIGGLSASLILMPLFDPFTAIWAVGLIDLAAALAILKAQDKGRFRTTTILVSILFVSGIAGLFLKWPEQADSHSMARSWRGYELVDSKNSIYGNIAVLKRGRQLSFFDNGLRLFTIPDRQSCEESVHFALLEHPDPKKVLLIGGGAGGLAGEILKHPIDRLDYVELDPLIIDMARQYGPEGHRRALEDPRVSIKTVDGRYFVKNSRDKYDCIIISLGDPHTAQINRFYTVEFYDEAANVMNDGGILSFGVTASESYVNSDTAYFLGSVYLTLKKVFSDVVSIPGETAYMVASNKSGVLTYDQDVLMSRAAKRGLDLSYVREYYLQSKMAPDKVRYLEGAILGGAKNAKPNFDLRPISYYYDMVSWAGRFKDSWAGRMLKAARGGGLWISLIALYITIVISVSYILSREKRPIVPAVLFSVATIGFGVMSLQIVIILSFQIIYGYLFYKVGLILTAFMTGLALGGYTATKRASAPESDRMMFRIAQGAMIFYPALLWLLFWRPSNAMFILMPAMAGFIGGFQFPLAGRICAGVEPGIGKAAGHAYGADLIGSCIGALLTGSLLIPVLGIPKTCVIVSFVNAVAFILLLKGNRR